MLRPNQCLIFAFAIVCSPTWGESSSKIVFSTSGRNGNTYIVNPDGSDRIIMQFLDPMVERLHPSYKEAWYRYQWERFHMDTHGASGELVVTDGEKPYIRRPDGSRLGLWDDHPPMPSNPVWSPDKTKLAFCSVKDGDPDVYVISADGTDARNLSNNDAADYAPVWSPDGSHLLYDSNQSGDWDVWEVAFQDGRYKKRCLSCTPKLDDMGGVWSPSGRRIVFHGPEGPTQPLYVIRSDGKERIQLTSESPGHFEWNQAGSHLAFDALAGGTCDIFVVNSDGSNAVNISRNLAGRRGCGHFAWSPDGRQLVFTSNRTGSVDVYRSLRDGSQQMRITDSEEEEDVHAWYAIEQSSTSAK